MHKRLALLLGCIAATATLPAQAATDGVGFKLGTLGLGAEYSHPLGENLSGRLGFNAFNFSHDFSTNQNDYQGDVRLRSFSALLDWYPAGGGFRVSAGALYNGNKVDLTTTDAGQVKLGGTLYDITGRVDGRADFNKLAPYLGVGWDLAFGAHDRWSLAFDLGVMYQGSPNVDLSASGTFTEVGNPLNTGSVADTVFQSDLKQEQAKLEDDLRNYKYFPVLALTLIYRFW